MKRLFAMLVAVVAVVTTSACGSSTDTTPAGCNYTSTFMTNLQGTWVQCSPVQGTALFQKTTLTVSCLNVAFANARYTDQTCTTQTVPPVVVSSIGTLAIGAAQPTTGWVPVPNVTPPVPAPVNAYQLNINVPQLQMQIYTLGFINGTSLYVGDFNTALPYPTLVWPVYPFVKQ